MRTFLSVLSALLCGFMLIGAAGPSAPVMQSQSYYINDHAGVIEKENRDSMLKTAQELYEKTGVRLVLLTIEDLDGRTPEEYAELIFKAWEIDSGGIGILILLSTEEKRFAIWSNADDSSMPSITAADGLAGADQFDLAAYDCYKIIADSIYINNFAGTGIVADDSKAVDSDISATGEQGAPKSQNTEITASTQDIEGTGASVQKKDIFLLIILILFILISMRAAMRNSKRRKNAGQDETVYLRKVYSPDEPITVRYDDVDYPSGFGGLGNRKAIYFEDVDAADDIGIIKRKNSNFADPEE